MSEERPAPGPDDPGRVDAPTILVVDDSRAVRAILRRGLVEAGYRAREAENGLAGLAACREEVPDLVLLDIDMPVMDGLATLEAMKREPALAGIPVLFLTARVGGSDVVAGLALGAQDYLRKPCDPGELAARVAMVLRLRAQEVALQQEAAALDELSTIDPLTRLGNRRRLELWGAELASRSGSSAPVGLLIIDLDHFKAVNDTEGHLVGDAVLRVTAARLRNAVPEEVLVVRWGGEEFVVVTAGPAGDDLTLLAEQLRLAVGGSPFAIEGDRQLALTVSVGGAAGTIGDLDALTGRADTCLYDAKRSGRNRVVVDTG